MGFDDPIAANIQGSPSGKYQWQLVNEWLTSVVNSIGVEELLRSDDGIDLLLDTLIPEVWDFKVDIIIIAAKDEHTYLEALLRRGQSIIIIASEDCDDAMEQSNPQFAKKKPQFCTRPEMSLKRKPSKCHR